MLTPNQIKNHTFNYTRGNYKAVEVDTFMEEVLASYEQMFHENGDLIKKLEAAAKRLEEYKTDEDKIKSALITAQKMADKMVSDAQSKSDKLSADAEKKAKKTVNTAQDKADKLLAESNANAASTLESAENKANEVIESAKLLSDNVIAQAKEASEEIVSNAKREVEISQNVLNQIKAETDTFKKELLAKYQSHLELIEQLPEHVVEAYEQQAAQEEAARQEEAAAEVQPEEAPRQGMEAQEQEAQDPAPEAEETAAQMTDADMLDQLRSDEIQNGRVPDLEEEIAPPVKPASLRFEDAVEEEDDEAESADEEDAASFRNFFKRNQ